TARFPTASRPTMARRGPRWRSIPIRRWTKQMVRNWPAIATQRSRVSHERLIRCSPGSAIGRLIARLPRRGPREPHGWRELAAASPLQAALEPHQDQLAVLVAEGHARVLRRHGAAVEVGA